MHLVESGKTTSVSRIPKSEVLKFSEFTVLLVVTVIFLISVIGQKKYLIVLFIKYYYIFWIIRRT